DGSFMPKLPPLPTTHDVGCMQSGRLSMCLTRATRLPSPSRGGGIALWVRPHSQCAISNFSHAPARGGRTDQPGAYTKSSAALGGECLGAVAALGPKGARA